MMIHDDYTAHDDAAWGTSRTAAQYDDELSFDTDAWVAVAEESHYDND